MRNIYSHLNISFNSAQHWVSLCYTNNHLHSDPFHTQFMDFLDFEYCFGAKQTELFLIKQLKLMIFLKKSFIYKIK